MKIHLLKTHLVNSIIIEYPERILIMDVAIRCHREVIHFVEVDLNRPLTDIELVICTHDDPDHMGGIKALAAAANANIAIPYASGSTLKKLLNDPTGSIVRIATSLREATRGRAWKMYANPKRNKAAKQRRGAQQAAQVKQHRTIRDPHAENFHPNALKHGQTIDGFEDWKVIHTPGHSWDSCCFYHSESSALISGDTLLGAGKIGLLVKPAIYANPIHFKKTIRRLQRLSINAVYPGHGSVMRGDNLLEHLS